jgi:hypothetical protein
MSTYRCEMTGKRKALRRGPFSPSMGMPGLLSLDKGQASKGKREGKTLAWL